LKIIIAGGRDYTPTREAWFWLRDTLKELGATEIISGHCVDQDGNVRGADKMGEDIAEKLGIPLQTFAAMWSMGKKAGPIRNGMMAEYAEACILFPGGRGTADMKQKALAKGLRVIEYKE
jgi:hypothetical protein